MDLPIENYLELSYGLQDHQVVYESHANPKPTRESILQDLRNATSDNSLIFSGSGTNFGIRDSQQLKFALSLGSQGGLHYQSSKISSYLNSIHSNLDEVFNFSPLIFDNIALPPSIRMMTNRVSLSKNQKNLKHVRIVYKIETKTRLVSTIPTWRSYLIQYVKKPSNKDVPLSLLPSNYLERQRWSKAIDKGFKIGVRQANNVFKKKLTRLENYYLGMILFRKLELSGMVSMPIIGVGRYGVNVNGTDLASGVTEFNVDAPASFLDAANWKPSIQTKTDIENILESGVR